MSTADSPRHDPLVAAPLAGTILDLPVLCRALAVGAGVAAAVAAVVWLLGCVPAESVSFFWLGLGASVVAAMLALLLHSRVLDPRKAAPFAANPGQLAGRFHGLLAAAFGSKLAILVLGVLALRKAGVKFDGLATFCVTFAAASVICQVATAGYLSRMLQYRPKARLESAQPASTARD
jgi:hypothetical protein